MASSAADKTLPATPRRRDQARAAGRVATSPDLGSAVLLLGSLAVLLLTGGELVQFLVELLRSSLRDAWRTGLETTSGSGQVSYQWNMLVPTLGRLLLPLLSGATCLALGVPLLQTGFLFRPQHVLPDASRISPASGWARLFSGASLSRLAFGVFKVVVVASVALAGLWSRREELLGLAALEVPGIAAGLWKVCSGTALQMGGALLALAIVDYGLARYRLERELQMTPEEMREEQRELQGDPQVAARRRQLARRPADDTSAAPPSSDRRVSAGASPVHVGPVESIR